MDYRTMSAVVIMVVLALGAALVFYLTRHRGGGDRYVSRLDKMRRPRSD